MRKVLFLFLLLAGCNSVYIKPGTLEKESKIYANRGGYSIGRAIKNEMGKRGYTVSVGRATNSHDYVDDLASIDMDATLVPKDTKYIIKVREFKDDYRPVWCSLNGIWWWDFNVSIAEQETGEEILTWRGRGCQNSSIRVFNRILDKLEK